MKEVFRPKEVNSSSHTQEVKRRESIFRPKQTQETAKPRSPSIDSTVSKSEKQSKLRKVITAAFTTTTTAAVVAVAILTSSLNSVSLYAKTASSLTFLVDFSERGEIVYELQNSRDYFESIVDDINTNYVSFYGLEPASEYTFSVVDVSEERNVLFSKSYYTSSDDVSVDGEYSLSEDGLYGMLWINDGTENETLDIFWSVVIQDVNTKNVYSADTTDRFVQFELPYLKDSKYYVYAKYGGQTIYANTILAHEEPASEPFANLGGEFYYGSIDLYYEHDGYENVTFRLEKDGEVIYTEELTDHTGNLHYDNCEGSYIAYLCSGRQIIYELPLEDSYIKEDDDSVTFVVTNVYFKMPEIVINYYVVYNGKDNITYDISVESAVGETLRYIEGFSELENEIAIADINDSTVYIKFIYDGVALYYKEFNSIPVVNAEYIDGELSINYEVFDSNYYTIYVYDINESEVYNSPLSMEGYLDLPSLTDSYYKVVLMTENETIYSTKVYKDSDFSVDVESICADGSLDLTITASNDTDTYTVVLMMEDTAVMQTDDMNGSITLHQDGLEEGFYDLFIYSNGNLIYSSQIEITVSVQELVYLPDLIIVGTNGYSLPDIVEGIEVTYSLSDDTTLSLVNNNLSLLDPDVDVQNMLIAEGDNYYKEVGVLSMPRLLRENVDESSYTITLSNVYYDSSIMIYLDENEVNGQPSTSEANYTLTISDLNPNTEYSLTLYYGDILIYSSTFITGEIVEDDEPVFEVVSQSVSSTSFNLTFVLLNAENQMIALVFDGEVVDYRLDNDNPNQYILEINYLQPDTSHTFTVYFIDESSETVVYEDVITTLSN